MSLKGQQSDFRTQYVSVLFHSILILIEILSVSVMFRFNFDYLQSDSSDLERNGTNRILPPFASKSSFKAIVLLSRKDFENFVNVCFGPSE